MSESFEVIDSMGLFISFSNNSGFELFNLTRWVTLGFEYPHCMYWSLCWRNVICKLPSIILKNWIYLPLYRSGPTRMLCGFIKVARLNRKSRVWVKIGRVEYVMVTKFGIWFPISKWISSGRVGDDWCWEPRMNRRFGRQSWRCWTWWGWIWDLTWIKIKS